MATESVIGIAISVIALGASIWTTVTTKRHDSRLLQLEHAREADRVRETKSAKLIASMTRSAHSGRLRIINRGQAAARNVRVAVDGVSLDAHKLLRGLEHPVAVIGAGSTVEALLMTFDGMQGQYQLELVWDDESGQPGRWTSTVTLQED
jgi:hypothetical protein